MSNLYDGRKWMSGSWKPLKMDPGTVPALRQPHRPCVLGGGEPLPTGPHLSSSPG